jgi:hypothetical protein
MWSVQITVKVVRVDRPLTVSHVDLFFRCCLCIKRHELIDTGDFGIFLEVPVDLAGMSFVDSNVTDRIFVNICLLLQTSENI